MKITNIPIYIHIPFCEKKCNYCDFPSFANQNERYINIYLECLENELKELNRISSLIQAKTIYIGGGTPTFLSETQLERLFIMLHKYIGINDIEEFTVEMNPGSVSNDKLKILKQNGINRISLGVQSLNDRELDVLGRIHNSNDVYRTIDLLVSNDFNNWNIDLMYGIPEQTVDSWIDTLAHAIKFKPKHISTYNLKIEENTKFYNLYQNKELLLPDEENIITMYQHTIDNLIKESYKHYEISNFCIDGYQSKHNLIYWDNYNYIGIGSSAWSFIGNIRYSNPTSIGSYIETYKSESLSSSWHDVLSKKVEIIDCNLRCQMEDYIMLGLRKIEGISVADYKRRYLQSFEANFSKQIEKLLAHDLMVRTNRGYKLTDKGVLLSNEVIEEFFE
jgi:oxygen-independent coproporphyrinogen-3 oxidase